MLHLLYSQHSTQAASQQLSTTVEVFSKLLFSPQDSECQSATQPPEELNFSLKIKYCICYMLSSGRTCASTFGEQSAHLIDYLFSSVVRGISINTAARVHMSGRPSVLGAAGSHKYYRRDHTYTL